MLIKLGDWLERGGGEGERGGVGGSANVCYLDASDPLICGQGVCEAIETQLEKAQTG